MYHSKIVVIAWLLVFAAAMIAALIKWEMKALLMIVAGAGIMGVGIGASKWLANEYGALVLSVCLLASALATLWGIITVFKREDDSA